MIIQSAIIDEHQSKLNVIIYEYSLLDTNQKDTMPEFILIKLFAKI